MEHKKVGKSKARLKAYNAKSKCINFGNYGIIINIKKNVKKKIPTHPTYIFLTCCPKRTHFLFALITHQFCVVCSESQ